MEIRYKVTGAEKQRLVNCISVFLGCEKRYLGVPSCAYQVGAYHISTDGTVTFDERGEAVNTRALLAALKQEGFYAAHTDGELPVEDIAEKPDAEPVNESDSAEQEEPTGLTVSVPLSKVAVGNLINLLDAKGGLIKKALGISELPIVVGEDTVSFPWFSLSTDADTAKAYTDFITALCKMSKAQKRINATEKEVTNEKYSFRCFLLRLGFIGAEYKQDRKILLKNLTGSSAFKKAREVE